jgi:two-component system KDP operon response regulator KdpE
VRNLRQKLEEDPASPAIIVNELGVGYRLMADAG